MSGPSKSAGHWLFWGITVAGVTLDLITKSLVFSYLKETDQSRFYIIPGVLDFTMDTNTGGPFSVFRGNAGWLAAATVVALLVIGYLYLSYVRAGQRSMVIALALVAGGALGNCHDRITLGQVRDFIQVWIGKWPYPTFNVADILLCSGAGLIVLALLLPTRTPSRS